MTGSSFNPKRKHARDYIIFALDVPSAREAGKLAQQLSGHVGMFKIGLELFIQSGPEIVQSIRKSGPSAVFLDLKLHDIPQTVFRAMRVIADCGVSFTTVHCGESMNMLRAAVQGAGGRVKVLGVTILTSVSEQDLKIGPGHPDPASTLIDRVLGRVEMAHRAGCDGVICSGREVQTIKQRYGHAFLAVTPGIRPSWEKTEDDQARVTTPAEAIVNGADYLVIGQPIRDAQDPCAAADRITAEIEGALFNSTPAHPVSEKAK
ncbi:MAG: orotidine-5'-phosphate decarboxylase [Deltaproteobacteria bacterium]|nr:orotidine-5'-phosphate decarboxylase [Deltaproteobacteria bacterium]